MSLQPTSNYLLHAYEQTQSPVYIAAIFGVSDLFTSTDLTVPLKYGDRYFYGTGLLYGQSNHSYGAYGQPQYRNLLDIGGSSLTISQKVEPEQGRASVTQLSLSFIDKDSYMTQLCTPGYIIPDLLGAEVKVFIGYQGDNYPDDYLQIFRGYVSGYSTQAGKCTISLSDPNVKRRQSLFQTKTTTLSAGINSSVTTIPVTDSSTFYTNVVGPDGSVGDAGTIFYAKIDDEIISYTGLTSTSLTGCGRNARGTTAAPHSINAVVSCSIQLQDHAIDMALKLMLSGWAGSYLTGETCTSIGSVTSTTMILAASKDAKADYGLTEGDWLTISGSGSGNDGDYQITAIANYLGLYNARMEVTPAFPASEVGTSLSISFRSQYDVYPVSAGLKLAPTDVDVEQHLNLKNTFLVDAANSYQFFITDVESSGKTFIESQIYLPFSMYSLTKKGRLSVNLTHPPIGGETLITLDQNNILDPQSIRPNRATNNRKFFNDIEVSYDYSDAQVYASNLITTDNKSLTRVGFRVTLPIESKGAKTALGTDVILSNKAQQLLSRYRLGAVQLNVKVNYATGNRIEAGDVVALKDLGTLMISNFQTGERDLGYQFFEVEDRRMDFKSANCSLSLIGGIGGQVTDRFGLISPSSDIASATSSYVIIQDSYGALYPFNEGKKWVPYIGQKVLIHSADYSVNGEATLDSQDLTNLYKFYLTPALSFTPAAGYLMDIVNYPTSTDPAEQALYKSSYVYTDPQVQLTGGTSSTVFTVSSGDASKFVVNQLVRVHNATFSSDSGDVLITAVSGTTITVEDMGFTPSSSYYADLIGFYYDGGNAYRYYIT